jgi:uncharacterized protein (TIGR03083 family)
MEDARMEITGFIETLRLEGPLLAGAAERAGLDAPVPTCPGWTVRDLLVHTGAVHRWAGDYVLDGGTEGSEWDESAAPGDAALIGWYRDAHRRLGDALAAAPADLACWYFFSAASPLAFWARRQAHETTVHRIDVQTAQGHRADPVDPAFAADGVDELLTGFHGRARSRVRTAGPRTLLLCAEDRGRDWLVHLSPERPVVERGVRAAADCTVSGTATDLYLALWNRGPYDTLTLEGDASLVDLWRRTAAIT